MEISNVFGKVRRTFETWSERDGKWGT